MAMGTCCPTWICQSLRSRESKLPHWQQLRRRGASSPGGVPQLRNSKQATGHSGLCRCIETQQQASAGPDISLLRPELQKQWHHDKNQHLGDKRITASSGLRVWHGSGNLLRNMGLVATRQQAIQASALASTTALWFVLWSTAQEQQAGNWILETVPLH
ncbi:hypothetical protein WJX82_000760 [Trebouxia sp. C0006]